MLQWLIIALVFLVAAKLLPGIQIEGFWVILLAALALSTANCFVRLVLFYFNVPVNDLTLGASAFVINMLMVVLISAFVPGFVVHYFLSALALAIIVSLVKLLFLH